MKFILTFLLILAFNVVSSIVIPRRLDIDCKPKYQGYLVQRGSNKCLTGQPNGYAIFGECKDEYKLCTDGSIRRVNTVRDTAEECLQNSGTVVKHMSCSLLHLDPKMQKWNVTEREDVVFREQRDDKPGGLEQTIVSIQNVDQICLTNAANCLQRAACCYPSDIKQQFYFRSRGKMVKQGKVFNRYLNTCLGSKGTTLDNCAITANQTGITVKFYENGEMVSEGKCYEADNNPDSISFKSCDLSKNQQWDISSCNKDDSCLIINVGANTCLKFDDGKPISGNCNLETKALFVFVNGDWDISRPDFVKLACNQDGEIKVELQNEVKYGDKSSYQTEFKHQYDRDSWSYRSYDYGSSNPFYGYSYYDYSYSYRYSTTQSLNLEQIWEENYGSTVKTIMTCENYEDSMTVDDNFTHGCMWQLKVTTFNRKFKTPLEWRPPIVKCTRSSEHPRCGVFMKCSDKVCSKCIPEEQVTA